MTTATPAALLAGAALLLSACGDSSSDDTTTTTAARTTDSASIEQQIDKQLTTSAAQVTKVKCPDEIPAGDGKTFTCTVTWSTGASGKVKATSTGANRYTYAPVAGSVKIPGSKLEKQITDDLAQQGAPDATANCPDTVAVKVGTTVTCDVAGAGGSATGTVKFTFSSADGTVDSSSVETG
jgi:hypothetical protein